MALLLGRRLRRRAAIGLVMLLVLYYLLRVDVCLRCLYSNGLERPKCHHVYSRYALLGGPVVCMERHWSRAMHGRTGPLSIWRSFAFDRAVAQGLRRPSDEVAELGFNRTDLAQQELIKRSTKRDWPLLPSTTVVPPKVVVAAGLHRVEPAFTFSGLNGREPVIAEFGPGGNWSDRWISTKDDMPWPKECVELRYSLFIPHHHTSSLSSTLAAVGSAMAFGAERIFVVDTSDDESATKSSALAALEVHVLQPARGVPLPYMLLHEFIRREAIATNLDVYFYMHTDVTLGRGVVSEALRALCVLRAQLARDESADSTSRPLVAEADSSWEDLGAIMFKWDMFCAFSTAAMAATGPFDPGIYWGKVDFDYLRRLELQGYKVYNGRPKHLLDIPWPWPKSIVHEGSHTLHLEQSSAPIGAETTGDAMRHADSRRTAEQLSRMLFDYVGRFVYFPLKWGSASPDATWPNAWFERRSWPNGLSASNPSAGAPSRTERVGHPLFAEARDGWMWLQILLRAPAPSFYSGNLVSPWVLRSWDTIKKATVVAVVSYPIVLALALMQAWSLAFRFASFCCGAVGHARHGVPRAQRKVQKVFGRPMSMKTKLGVPSSQRKHGKD